MQRHTFLQRILIVASLLTLFAPRMAAEILDPVKWHFTLKMISDTQGEVVIKADIEQGWHIYSNTIDPALGPTPLSIDWKVKGVTLEGDIKPLEKPQEAYDKGFDATLSWWSNSLTIKQAFTATAPEFAIAGNVRFMACNDQRCLPPTKETFSLKGNSAVAIGSPKTTADSDTVSMTASVVSDITADSLIVGASLSENKLWAPVTTPGEEAFVAQSNNSSLWWIFGACFVGGLLALFTPCVWPLIPMTVSFFLKKNKSRRRAIADAGLYALSIIIIYVALGLIVTAIFGASALNAMATSAVCNLFFFALLVLFAVSFLGAFEIKIPSRFVNLIDSRAETATSIVGIFFMAFTLALVSFSCTGPIIGTLLVEAASAGVALGPAVGMLGFSLALAIPFALFAMFPTWLKSAPRSGGWMETVKVTLGFIELALSLKFLSVADLAYGWHILDREAFLALWIVIFGLLGIYLLGNIRFAGYDQGEGISVGRFFVALASLSFMVYLIPGLWGAPLKGVSAFVPPLYTQDFNLYGESYHVYNDYEEGMAQAAHQGKPVFIDFSGYGCVNCRKMEGAVLDRQEIKTMIQDNFVAITLMVDDKTPLQQPITVNENGKTITLDTQGDKWSYLQRHKFGANAQPYYVVLNAKGEMLSGPYSYDENAEKFVRFLEQGIQADKK